MRRLALQQFPRDALLKLSNNNGLREGAAVSLHRVRSLSAACRLSAPQLSRSRASVVSPHTRAGRPLHTQGRKTLLVPSPLRSPQPIPLVGGRRFFVSETTVRPPALHPTQAACPCLPSCWLLALIARTAHKRINHVLVFNCCCWRYCCDLLL